MYATDLAELSEFLMDGSRGWTCLTTVCADDGETVLGRLRIVGLGDATNGFDFVSEFDDSAVAA